MDPQMIKFQFPGLEHVHCVFGGRSSGEALAGNISYKVGDDEGRVTATRQAIKIKLAAEGMLSWRECNQVHGDRIIIGAEEYGEALPDADGMMTSAKGCGLLIKTADCQPLLFASADGRHIMAIHAGWRGNRINFPATAVKLFCKTYQLAPTEIFVVRGPSLGPANAQFINFAKEWGDEFGPWFDKRALCMDLWQLSRYQLVSAGVPENHIYGIDICTSANDNLFFSYRRDRQCGRQGSLIWIADD